MRLLRTCLTAGAAWMMLAAAAVAQTTPAPRSAVSLVASTASADSTTGPALGGSWLFDLNELVSLEAQGMYLDRGVRTDAVSVSGTMLVNLLPASGLAVPYAAVGGGIYRTTFEFANADCPGLIGYCDAGPMSHFYARRFGPMAFPAGGASPSRSFTDPAMTIGGGLRLNINEHVMIRPDVRALVIFADGDAHTVGVYGVQLGFRF